MQPPAHSSSLLAILFLIQPVFSTTWSNGTSSVPLSVTSPPASTSPGNDASTGTSLVSSGGTTPLIEPESPASTPTTPSPTDATVLISQETPGVAGQVNTPARNATGNANITPAPECTGCVLQARNPVMLTYPREDLLVNVSITQTIIRHTTFFEDGSFTTSLETKAITNNATLATPGGITKAPTAVTWSWSGVVLTWPTTYFAYTNLEFGINDEPEGSTESSAKCVATVSRIALPSPTNWSALVYSSTAASMASMTVPSSMVDFLKQQPFAISNGSSFDLATCTVATNPADVTTAPVQSFTQATSSALPESSDFGTRQHTTVQFLTSVTQESTTTVKRPGRVANPTGKVDSPPQVDSPPKVVSPTGKADPSVGQGEPLPQPPSKEAPKDGSSKIDLGGLINSIAQDAQQLQATKGGGAVSAPQSQGSGPAPQAQGNGPAPQSQGSGPAPQTQGSGPAPQAQGSGPAPQAQGSGLAPQTQGSGPGPQSQGSGPVPQTIMLGSSPVAIAAVPTGSGIIIGGSQTVAPNQAVTVNGVAVSVLPGGSNIVVDGSNTFAVPGAPTAPPAGAANQPPGGTSPPPLVIGGTTVAGTVVNGMTQFALGPGTVLSPGGSAIVVGGTTYSLPPSGSILIVDGVTSAIAMPGTVTPAPSAFAIGSSTLVPVVSDGTTRYIVDGMTLTPGGVYTIDGSTLSLGPSTAVILKDGKTIAASLLPAGGTGKGSKSSARITGSTDEATTTSSSPRSTNIGDFVASGIGVSPTGGVGATVDVVYHVWTKALIMDALVLLIINL
ncbi:hypothetical protein B0J12DRAFT_780921 [Macrophomina phaseolina]|uniref:Uncharacterized protein n=1 Tax=Macrophomina phaseolina TaxID=35725 RepID=A0ABQ8GRP7_9PEZI|nr:hypothetical protein B0J12DRAFT_780921 [Macrophomina phaseolina]